MRKNLLIPLAFMALPTLCIAQSYDDLAQVDVLTGWRTAYGDHIAAIKITLAPGWITYWRAPGDAGIPPQFQFSGSDSIESITPHWPVPQVSFTDGIRSIGYYDSVIFPITVDTNGDSGDINVEGEIFIGVCEEICIPVTLGFAAVLPSSGAPDGAISTALDAEPLSEREANVGDVTCTIDPISDGLRVTTMIDVAQNGTAEFVVIEASDPSVWVSEADVLRDGKFLSATVDMVHPSGQPFAFDRSGVRITVFGEDQAIDIWGCSAG